MEVAAQNLANADVTNTPEGGPYRRKEVVLASVSPGPMDMPMLVRMMRGTDVSSEAAPVEVVEVRDDPAPPRRVYDPAHPDADARGYVLMPNVDVPIEMADMMAAARAYEANAAALQAFRQSLSRALELLK
jgi:flagellar basal-body rod protein FlgC